MATKLGSIDFSQMVENSRTGFVIIKENEVLYANQFVYQLLGYNKGEKLELSKLLLSQFNYSLKERIKDVLEKGVAVKAFEQKLSNRNGSELYVEIDAVPYIHEDEICAQIHMKDISNQKSSQVHTEYLLRQSEKLALIGELSAGVVHEIKNPLTSIKGFLQLMQVGTIETKDYIAILNSEIDRIENIANDLLGFAKPKEEMSPINLDEIMDKVIFLMNAQAKKKNVLIKLYSKNTEHIVLGDKSQLKQVFINLVKNAIEASDNDSEISVLIEQKDVDILVKVKDSGCGISKVNLEKIGESFFTTKKKGTGLGLMVSYRIITNHNGRIIIDSGENEGTTFTVCLPDYKKINGNS